MLDAGSDRLKIILWAKKGDRYIDKEKQRNKRKSRKKKKIKTGERERENAKDFIVRTFFSPKLIQGSEWQSNQPHKCQRFQWPTQP